MIELLYASVGNIIGFRISDRLTDHDFSGIFLPSLRRLHDEYGTIHLLIEIAGFEGESLSRALQDPAAMAALEFVRRVAVVGDESRAIWMSSLVQSFIGGGDTEIRLFSDEQDEEAWKWVSLGGEHTVTTAASSGRR
ncbi:STAS/SEC14 domain-containing protein [Methanoculleus sp. FWC-SCC1]|uniref:STAS/SEC14 domain-containing protein n=1 Tax=Methanoculleus frigidifontis TaxID=2584085 RepID=A0ABT8MAG6_9EURY|nr:STAS/SEC14 domain-containing protein [Methanoculleus sp. FWC-SCC1]MDN7024939.1 STAS/SEC14 domain-containing protein [Methanoculleus sp. FWC-SCC1]